MIESEWSDSLAGPVPGYDMQRVFSCRTPREAAKMSGLNSLTLWITSSLYGGYVAANVLKWIWWRFNGYGYFWGMVAGLAGSTLKFLIFPETPDIYLFPLIFAVALAGSFLGCLLTQPVDDQTLISFYRNVWPWGW